MIILHLSIHEERSLLWGETPAQDRSAPAKRRGRRPKVARAAVSPYNVTPEQLSEALTLVGIDLAANTAARSVTKTAAKTGAKSPTRTGTACSMVAWLPSLADHPVGSSPLIAAPPEGEAVVRPWQVSALHLPAGEVVELLAACAGGSSLAHGVLAGDNLLYWAQALRFAGALAARGRFLPGVRQERGCLACPLGAGDPGRRPAAPQPVGREDAGGLLLPGRICR